MDENENDSSIQDVAGEEMEKSSIEQHSDEQVGESNDSLEILGKENEDDIKLSVDIQSEDQEFDSHSSIPVQQLQDEEPVSPDVFDVERYEECKSKLVAVQQLQDIEQLSPDTLDVDRYDEYESSIHLEDLRGVSLDEQKDQSRKEESDVGLEEQDSHLEQQCKVALKEHSDMKLEEQSVISLEQKSDMGMEEQSEIDLEEQNDVGLEVQSETGLEEQSGIDFEEQSELGMEEQSDIGFEEETCFDEQSYLSSGEEKADNEKIEARKLSTVAKPDRQKLIEIYQTLQCKESVLLKQNYKLQMRLGARLKSLEKQEYVSIPDKADIEEKYHALLGEIEEMWKTDAEQLEKHIREKKELKLLLAQNQQNLTQMKNDLFSKQKHTTLMAINTKTGRHISPEEIEMCLNRKLATDEEVRETRLKYVKEKRRLQKLQNFPSEKDTSPGSENVHFLQYEELRIASETNQMQLEKLAQELRKMNGVFSTYVQMVTHTKEKLLDLEPNTTFDDQSMDDEIVSKKEQLTHLKQKRNEAATRLERLRNHFGILSDQNLMRHYDKLQHDLHSLRIHITGIKSDLNENNIKK